MTTPDLVERLRGLANAAGRTLSENSMMPPEMSGIGDAQAEQMIDLMREAADRLATLRAEVIEECAVWIAENGPALSTLAAEALRRALSQEQSK